MDTACSWRSAGRRIVAWMIFSRPRLPDFSPPMALCSSWLGVEVKWHRIDAL